MLLDDKSSSTVELNPHFHRQLDPFEVFLPINHENGLFWKLYMQRRKKKISNATMLFALLKN